MNRGTSLARDWDLSVPPEWEIPEDMHDEAVTQAMVSACREGQVDQFEELFQSSEPGQIPPASYLIRLATESRYLPMLHCILKHYRIRSVMAERTKKDSLPWAERKQNIHYAVLLVICQGDLEMVQRFVKAGISVELHIEDNYNRNYSLLDRAIRADQVEVAAFLLKKGADPNRTVWYCTHSLSHAASHGNPEMLSLLVEFGGRIEGSRALWDIAHRCYPTSCAQTLIDAGADINEKFTTSWGLQGTALHAAACATGFDGTGNMVMATWLLEHGIDHTVEDGDGRTAVELAREWNYEELASMIEDWIADHAAI